MAAEATCNGHPEAVAQPRAWTDAERGGAGKQAQLRRSGSALSELCPASDVTDTRPRLLLWCAAPFLFRLMRLMAVRRLLLLRWYKRIPPDVKGHPVRVSIRIAGRAGLAYLDVVDVMNSPTRPP